MYIKPDFKISIEEAEAILEKINDAIQEKDHIIIKTIKSGTIDSNRKKQLLDFHNSLGRLVDCLDNHDGDDLRKLYSLNTDFNEILNDITKATTSEHIDIIIEKIKRILDFLENVTLEFVNKE